MECFSDIIILLLPKKCGTLPLMEHHFSPTSPRKDPSGPMLVKRKLPSP